MDYLVILRMSVVPNVVWLNVHFLSSLVSPDDTCHYQPVPLNDDRSNDRHTRLNQSTNITAPYCGDSSGLVEQGAQARLFTPALSSLPSKETAKVCSVAAQLNKGSLCENRSACMRAAGRGGPVATDKDDVPLLEWVSEVTGHFVSGYHE